MRTQRTRIAVLGAGSFVFGASVLHQAIVEQRMSRLHLALCDVSKDVLDPLAGVGRRLAREHGVDVEFSEHVDADAALDGADFVICAVAVDLRRRFAIDREIALRHDPAHLVSEFGGVCGISYSLRQIAYVEQLAWRMRRLCPRALLLSVSNPLPRFCHAANAMGISVAGFCSVSLNAFGMISRLLDDEPSRYPFEAPRQRYQLTLAGTNHLAWLTSVLDRRDGRERLPDLIAAVRAGRSAGEPRVESLLLETSALVSSGDEHSKDFLPPDPRVHQLEEVSHGTISGREAKIQQMREVADGRLPWQVLMEHPSWEKPLEVIHAMLGGPETDVHALNLPNAGQIDALPRGAIVETAARATSRGPVPMEATLPATVLPYSRSAIAVTETIVDAALSRSRRRVHDAIDLDPSIGDHGAAHRAIEECLLAHADLLPRYE
jgi:alpha-galactosidase